MVRARHGCGLTVAQNSGAAHPLITDKLRSYPAAARDWAVRDATTAGDSAQDVAVLGHRDDDLSIFRQQMPTGNRIGSSAPYRLHEAGVIPVAFLE